MTESTRDVSPMVPLPARLVPVGTTSATVLAREAALLALLVLAIIAATVLGFNHHAPVTIRAGDDLRFVFNGFWDVESNAETTFRWTAGDGHICIEQWGRSTLGTARIVLLGQGSTPLGVTQATLFASAEPIVVAPLIPATLHYHMLLGPQHFSSADLCFLIASDVAVVDTSSADARGVFGVPFHSLTAHQIVGGWTTPAPLQLVLNVALAILVALVLRYLGVPSWLAVALVVVGALLIALSLWSGRVISGIGMARTLVPLVALGAFALLGGAGLRLERARRRHPSWLDQRLGRDLAAMVCWSIVLVGAVWIIQAAQNRHGVWPLKAGIWPNWTPLMVVPTLLFAGWLAIILRRLRRADARRLSSLVTLLAGALVLPVTVKIVVRGLESVYYTFRDNPTDYIHDVPRVGNPLTFLGEYVAISPTLAWHNANHPPGSVLLLWAIEQLFGAGPVPASWGVIALGGLNIVAAFWLGWRLGGPRLAVLAGAILAVMPGFGVYLVTSMDTIFNATIALGAVAFFLALEPGASRRLALGAGTLIAIGLFFTFAATQLVFFGLAVCVLALLRGRSWSFVLRQAGLAALALVAIYGLIYATTGFNIVESAIRATANNARAMTRDAVAFEAQYLAPPSLQHYTYFLAVNIIPYLWYLAPWGLAALTPIVLRSRATWRRPTSFNALAIALVVWVGGMWLSGLFIREVERIWGFTYPLAAVLIAAHAWQGETLRERLWRAGLWIALFFAQTAIMYMFLNLYW
jgi:hypothetical protein